MPRSSSATINNCGEIPVSDGMCLCKYKYNHLIYPYGVMETRVTLTHKLLVQVQLRVPFGGRWLGLPHRGGTKGNKTHSNAREMLSITAGALCDEGCSEY